MPRRSPSDNRGAAGHLSRSRMAEPAERGAVVSRDAVVTEKPFLAMNLFSRLLYTVIAFTLLAAAVMLIGVAVWRTVTGYWTGEAAFENLLDAIGLIIIAVAVADVGKFLFEEEVLADRELRRPAEARGSLTKFMTIIIVALNLEALVLIAKTSRDRISDIVYPGMLALLGVIAMVGLGLFQRLSQNATAALPPERKDGDEARQRPVGSRAAGKA